MTDTLKQKTAKGLFWAVLNSGTTQVLNLIIGFILARLLSPEDYGIVGVLTIFTAIAGDLQSSGFTQALINIHRPTHDDYNSVFSFNVIVSITMYAILFVSAPWIADFFHQECLVSVSRFVFLGFVIAAVSIAHGGYMTKNMMNKEMAIIGAIALIASGTTGITLAFTGHAYWALAWQQVAYIAVITIGRYYYCHKHSKAMGDTWHTRLTANFAPVRRMFSFAVKILVTKIINTLSNNILTLIFGRLFPIRAVGNYSQAFKWDTMAHSLLTNTVGQVAQTVLVESGTEEGRELRVFRKMMRFTALLTMPVMLTLAAVAEPFILVTIGEKWSDCVVLLQILCLSGAFMPLMALYQNLAMSRGRSDLYMWLNIGQIVMLFVIIALCHSYGIVVMVIAYTVMMILWTIPWHLATGRLIAYSLADALKDIMPFLLTAAAANVVAYVLMRAAMAFLPLSLPPFAVNAITLIIHGIIASLLYYLVLSLAKVKILAECRDFVLSKLKK